MVISLCLKLLERAFYSILALHNSLKCYRLSKTKSWNISSWKGCKGLKDTNRLWVDGQVNTLFLTLSHIQSAFRDSLSPSVQNHLFPSHNSCFVFCMVAQFQEEAWGKSLASLFHRIRTLILQGGESWGAEQAAWDRN